MGCRLVIGPMIAEHFLQERLTSLENGEGLDFLVNVSRAYAFVEFYRRSIHVRIDTGLIRHKTIQPNVNSLGLRSNAWRVESAWSGSGGKAGTQPPVSSPSIEHETGRIRDLLADANCQPKKASPRNTLFPL
jgi:hypothetical protein